MTEPTDAERAEFEAWAIAEYISVNRSLDGTDGYFEGDSQIAWAAWQAARRTPTPQPTQAQAGAVPLTVDEVEQLIAQWSYEVHGDRARYLVRMTEQHHGIKGADHD